LRTIASSGRGKTAPLITNVLPLIKSTENILKVGLYYDAHYVISGQNPQFSGETNMRSLKYLTYTPQPLSRGDTQPVCFAYTPLKRGISGFDKSNPYKRGDTPVCFADTPLKRGLFCVIS